MARFFFHLRNSTGYLQDEEGQELADVSAARRAALESVRSIASEEAKAGTIDLRASIQVVDEKGGLVLELPFAEAVGVISGRPADPEPDGGEE